MKKSEGSSIVKLNIGGQKFMTTLATLLGQGEENLFGVLLKDGNAVVKDDEGAIFIDRDGAYFGVLLSFLRTGKHERRRRILLFFFFFFFVEEGWLF
jgi:hypothetical protein